MIEEVTGYQMDCDICGEPLDVDGSEHLFCDSEHALKEVAMCAGWVEKDGLWYCPDCAAMNALKNEDGETVPQEE